MTQMAQVTRIADLMPKHKHDFKYDQGMLKTMYDHQFFDRCGSAKVKYIFIQIKNHDSEHTITIIIIINDVEWILLIDL